MEKLNRFAGHHYADVEFAPADHYPMRTIGGGSDGDRHF